MPGSVRPSQVLSSIKVPLNSFAASSPPIRFCFSLPPCYTQSFCFTFTHPTPNCKPWPGSQSLPLLPCVTCPLQRSGTNAKLPSSQVTPSLPRLAARLTFVFTQVSLARMGHTCSCLDLARVTFIMLQISFTRTELLLEKGYVVHGIIRRSSSFNTSRINHLFFDQHERTLLSLTMSPFPTLIVRGNREEQVRAPPWGLI